MHPDSSMSVTAEAPGQVVGESPCASVDSDDLTVKPEPYFSVASDLRMSDVQEALKKDQLILQPIIYRKVQKQQSTVNLSPKGSNKNMKYIVYLADKREVISCDPDEFFSPAMSSVDDIEKLIGKIIRGVCLHDDIPVRNSVLLQVTNKDCADASVKFLRRVLVEKEISQVKTNSGRLDSLMAFNVISDQSQKKSFPKKRKPGSDVDKNTACGKRIRLDPQSHKENKLPVSEKRNGDVIDSDLEQNPDQVKLVYSDVESIDEDEPPVITSKLSYAPSAVQRGLSMERLTSIESPSAPEFQDSSPVLAPVQDISPHMEDSATKNKSEASTFEKMKEFVERNGYTIKDEATFLLLCHISDKLDDMDAKIESLESKLAPKGAVELDLPAFRSVEDLKHIPKEIGPWMLQQGGTCARQFINNCLNKLIAPTLQIRLNRSGINGKLKFPTKLENQVKDCVYRLFPNTTAKEVESLIMLFLKHSMERLKNTVRRSI